jgi:hypothetical protein
MATDENRQRIIKFVQELLLDSSERSSITPAVIDEKIDMVVAMKPSWGENLDRALVIEELIRRFSLWIGQDATLKDDVGHRPWLNAARKRDWRYWQRYREWLETKLSWKAVDALDESTDTVLGLLEDPTSDGPWDRRGLVVGHVQSGKTGNYSGLICKAADAGYKIIVVLAGLHNNLRSQTQMRLDEGFLGYETKPVPDHLDAIGVGLIDGDPRIRPNYATNRADNGDFNAHVAKNLGVSPEQRPWLFVVKKNKSVLTCLFDWIRNHVANTQDSTSGRKVVTHLPLLVIDDEADNASVDTGEQLFDEDGKPDTEHEPTAINSLIRKILHSFTRSAYVGYTATPFANVFIHERGETNDEGPDLFPSAFIVNLAAPSNYVGPSRVFGLPGADGQRNGLPLIREVDDFASADGTTGWMPQKHKNLHQPLHEGADSLPPSLVEAVDAFLLACAARTLRGQQNEHSSMLVHVTRFNWVQKEVHRQLTEHLRELRQRVHRGIGHEPILERLRGLWERDFLPTTAAVSAASGDSINQTSWDEIAAALPDVIADIDVRMINGTAKDALDYADTAAPLKVIAVGGDKLARGLTLEGLCVSYFLRASRMYDTLMQMGRWFGYRPGYLDLCRLYTAGELVEWFGHITDASAELREEFDLMVARGGTPRDYGLKVQSHSVLMITSRLKMRRAKDLMISFSGQLLETVAFYRNSDVLAANLAALRRLVADLGPADEPEKIVRARDGSRQTWDGFLWRNVVAENVMAFLSEYRTHPEAHKVNSAMICSFIRSMTEQGELTAWTVAAIGSAGKGGPIDIAPGVGVQMLERVGNGKYDDRYSIGRLMSPRDEAIDLDENEWKAARDVTQRAWRGDPASGQGERKPDAPNGPAVRKIRGEGALPEIAPHPERGLLLLYVIDPALGTGLPERSPQVAAFGISFPGSRMGVTVGYKVNNVLWEQEFGPVY